MYRILYGLPAMNCREDLLNDKGEIIDKDIFDQDGEPWCDFEVCYVPEENFYSLCFETMIGFEENGGCRRWIINCFSGFTNYMHEKGHDTKKELSLYEVFTEGINVNTRFKTIEDAYAYMKFVVFGFHGDGLTLQGELD